MPNVTKRNILAIVGCLAFLSLPVVTAPRGGPVLERFRDPAIVRDLIGYGFALLFFTLHYYVLIPRLLFRRKNVAYAVLVILCFILMAFHPTLPAGIFPESMPPTGPAGHREGFSAGPQRNIVMDLQHNFLRFSLVFFTSLLLRINDRLRKSERDRREAEMAFLKAQINPHFVFNSLNTIYALAIESSEHTPDAVAKLSGMMRYVAGDAGWTYVALTHELAYLSDFIELQKLRFGSTADVTFRIDGDPTGLSIAPLILIPFIENAFKYGINPETESQIRIHIDIQEHLIKMTVVNRKTNIPSRPDETTGLGIDNTRRRIETLYPGKHQLQINNQPDTFTVTLILQL